MPSNSFRSSQLRALLERLEALHGDCDIALPVPAADRIFAVTEKDVVPATSFAGQPLPAMVFAIQPRDPVTDYATDESSNQPGWNYTLAEAPLDTDVGVYKRFGGEDRGRRGADGKWHVYEGGVRAWPVAPGGVLAWRALEPAL